MMTMKTVAILFVFYNQTVCLNETMMQSYDKYCLIALEEERETMVSTPPGAISSVCLIHCDWSVPLQKEHYFGSSDSNEKPNSTRLFPIVHLPGKQISS